MNRPFLRAAALVLAAALIATFVSAAQINTGTRHVPASALSAAAEDYYTGTSSFAALRTLPASASQPMRSPLYRALHELMASTIRNSYSYNSLPSHWRTTDCSDRTGTLYFYSDSPPSADSTLSREHVWPKSHGTFYQSGAGSDLHHLRPEDSVINSTRNNYAFGCVRGVRSDCRTKRYAGRDVLWYDPGGTGLVEVADGVKGDVARILLYVYVTYEQPNLYQDTPATGEGNLRSDGRRVIESLDTLLSWCYLDPVDEWELQRNELTAQKQGNRNVFIDYPELAWLLFDRAIPAMPTPSGYAAQVGERFTDVPKAAWYRSGVHWAAEAGLMEGVGAGRFAPERALTRAQLVTILYRMAGSPTVDGSAPFRDVPAGQWDTDAVCWAASRGIVNGVAAGRFAPDQRVTREQLVTILYRYAGAAPGQASLSRYPDSTRVSPYAREAFAWALDTGLVAGIQTPQGLLLSPASGATRAQFAVILQRWLG